MIYEKADVALSILAATLVQASFGYLLSQGEPHPVHAEISDDRAKPVSVEIVPMVSDLPLLKLGGKRQPGRLPDMWQKPRQVPRKAAEAEHDLEGATPSTKASASPDAANSAKVSDAGNASEAGPLDAELVKKADDTIPNIDASPPPSIDTKGDPGGVKEGTETDPLKAQQVNLYAAQLSGWFRARFPIRGKVPFDQLKTLHSTVTVDIGDGRKVKGFTFTPSGNAVFDDVVQKSLGSIQASGAELPAPPDQYPDILGQRRAFTFKCDIPKQCE
ncbi:MAG: hypothetical protein NVS3B20_02580 [Polyangiales bacterium]